MSRKLFVVTGLAVLATACAVRPPYVAPTVAPVALRNVDTAVSEQSFDPRWWQLFEDPVLDDLVGRALVANHDVRIAVARLDQARAIFADVKNDRYPVVTAGAAVDHRDEAVPGLSNEPVRVTTYSLGFDAFWEIDVFGRIRSQVRAAAATAESFEADVDDVRVSVAAEVARNYFELRGLQQQLAVADRSLMNQRETLRLTEVRRDALRLGQLQRPIRLRVTILLRPDPVLVQGHVLAGLRRELAVTDAGGTARHPEVLVVRNALRTGCAGQEQ